MKTTIEVTIVGAILATVVAVLAIYVAGWRFLSGPRS